MTVLEELMQKHPVRHTREQKAAFRAYAQQKAASMGYKVRVEQNDRFVKHNNIIIGDPERAVATFTAHYDTPAAHLLPSLIIPKNIPVFYAWQLLSVLLLLVITLAVTVLAGLVLPASAILWVFVGVYFGLLMLMNYGPANKHNANNNTSGVAAIFETMAAIPEDKRNKIAFILFDDSEKGKQGASCYGKTHLQVQSVRTIVNLDCVGAGQDFLVFSRKMARMRPEYARLCTVLQEDDSRRVHILDKGLCTYTSDHDRFECGVAILACKQSPGVGWYVPHLNTKKDTDCDQDNLTFLAQRFAAFAEVL